MKLLSKDNVADTNVIVADYLSDKFKTNHDGLIFVYHLINTEGYEIEKIRIDEIGDIEATKVHFLNTSVSIQELFDLYEKLNLDICFIKTIHKGKKVNYIIDFKNKIIRIGCNGIFNQEAEETIFKIESNL